MVIVENRMTIFEEKQHTDATEVAPPRAMGMNIRPEIPSLK